MPITARITTSLALLLGILTLAPAADAWRPGPDGTIPIADAWEIVETGDFFVIEGVVIEVKGKKLFRVQDDSGEMLVLIPEFLRRDKGTPKRNERIRVSGKFDRKKLDTGTQGMRAQQLHRLGVDSGHQGEKRAEPRPIPRTATPAAPRPHAAEPKVVQPTVSQDLVTKLGEKRRQYDAAKKEVEDAQVAYGRALRQAGSSGEVDPSVRQRTERAEQRLVEIRGEIAPLVEEAEQAGVPESTLRRYEELIGVSR